MAGLKNPYASRSTPQGSDYKDLSKTAWASKDPLTRVPPWLMPERSLDSNPSDDIQRSIAGQRGWLRPRQTHNEQRLMQQARTKRPSARRF